MNFQQLLLQSSVSHDPSESEIILKLYTDFMLKKHFLLQPEFQKCWDFFFFLNKMKTKRLSNHMSQYFIHNRT